MEKLSEAELIKVLAVDDEMRLCKFLSDALSTMGCRVHTEYTGELAYAAAKVTDFDVVIMDILMPGNGGIWALEKIKKARPLTEVIMITGYATVDSAEVCQSLGAFSFVAKPFEIEDLRLEIQKAFSFRREKLALLGNDPERTIDLSYAPTFR